MWEVSMLKQGLTALSVAALAVGLAASSAFAADAPTYGVLMKTLSNPFWGAMEKGVGAGAKAAGVDVYLQAVESDQAAEPQLNACCPASSRLTR
jgi:D-allose transport system substrate-binding protein